MCTLLSLDFIYNLLIVFTTFYQDGICSEMLQELGRRWHDLPKEEQQRYYELAKTDREQHMQKYPGWSARENYAINKKKKRKRDKSVGG